MYICMYNMHVCIDDMYIYTHANKMGYIYAFYISH